MRKLKHRKLIDLPVVSQLGSKLSEHSAARRKLASASASFLPRTQVWFRAWTPLAADQGRNSKGAFSARRTFEREPLALSSEGRGLTPTMT